MKGTRRSGSKCSSLPLQACRPAPLASISGHTGKLNIVATLPPHGRIAPPFRVGISSVQAAMAPRIPVADILGTLRRRSNCLPHEPLGDRPRIEQRDASAQPASASSGPPATRIDRPPLEATPPLVVLGWKLLPLWHSWHWEAQPSGGRPPS